MIDSGTLSLFGEKPYEKRVSFVNKRRRVLRKLESVMLKLILLAGVVLIALGIIGLNARIEGAALLLIAGAVAIGAGAIVGISAGGKEVRKRAGF